MKRFVFLSLLAVLSGCASSTAEKKETNSAVVTTTRTAPAKIKKTPTDYMTDQEKELKQVLKKTPFSVTRQNNILTISFSGDAIFAENSYHPTVKATEALKKTAKVLSTYTKTRISVIGYTDGMGKPATNQLMSEKRAESVAGILKKAAKIASVRFWIEGRGNDKTAENQSRHNGVQIILTPTFVQ